MDMTCLDQATDRMSWTPRKKSLGQAIGTWWFRSPTDPRWNLTGRGIVGGFDLPRPAKQHLSSCRGHYGAPPLDLEWGYIKDEG